MSTRTPSFVRHGLLAAMVSVSFASLHCGGGTSATATQDGGSSTPDGGGPPIVDGSTPLGVPTSHRPSPVACPTARPPGVNLDSGLPDSGVIVGACTSDSQCTQGTNGRCMSPGGNIAGYICSYDECATDSDCSADSVCQCGVGSSSGRTANKCVAGNCRVDSDCGAGGYCSPTTASSCGNLSGVVGYYCHTAADECSNDSDCADGGLGGYCAWQPTVAKWACSYGFCAG